MTDKERKLALYCLKASSDYYSEVCEGCINYPNCDHTGQDDVTETIIKALEQEPCDNAISREDALLALTGEWTELTDETIHRFIKRIKSLPPVTPQPKTGHWIMTNDYHTCVYRSVYYVECSCCHETSLERGDYCLNCGAKMIMPKESEDRE